MEIFWAVSADFLSANQLPEQQLEYMKRQIVKYFT